MRRYLYALVLLSLSSLNGFSQIYNPVSWSTKVNKISDNEFELIMEAEIEEGWHLYSQILPSDDGPIATEFTFPEIKGIEYISKVEEPKAITEYDPNFDMDLNYFEEKVQFMQRINRIDKSINKITAEVYFMVCDAEKCLPPEYVDLEFNFSESSNSEEKIEEGAIENLDNSTQEESGELNPVVWEYFAKKNDKNQYELHFKAEIEEGWHLYSQNLSAMKDPLLRPFIIKKGSML